MIKLNMRLDQKVEKLPTMMNKTKHEIGIKSEKMTGYEC